MPAIGIFLLSVALSIDAFFAGAAFGLRRVQVPLLSALLVGTVSGLVILAALLAGRGLALVLPPLLGPWLGGGLLMAVGLAILNQDLNGQNRQSMRDWPDFDRSGHISAWEAICLGAALAVDAFAAGIGAGLAGWQGPALPLAVAAVTTLSLMAGVLSGGRLRRTLRTGLAVYLPGTILIVLGLSRILVP